MHTHAYLDGAVPVRGDYLFIVILEAVDSHGYLTVALNTGQRVVSALPVQLQILLTRVKLRYSVLYMLPPLPHLPTYLPSSFPTSSPACSALSLHYPLPSSFPLSHSSTSIAPSPPTLPSLPHSTLPPPFFLTLSLRTHNRPTFIQL